MPEEGPKFYDNASVFKIYADKRNAASNANDTIEAPVIRALIGDVSGKSFLDMGCGDAGFGAELLQAGATSYEGVEGSRLMFEAACRRPPDPRLRITHADLRSWDYPASAFDFVVSRLALHYIEDVGAIFPKVFRSLKPSGRFVFSVEHPVITSCDKVWHGDGLRQDWIVDDYFRTGRRITSWLGSEVIKYHRTIEDYFSGLQDAGFQVQALREASPDRSQFNDDATYQRRKRIPLFLIIAAQRT
jgi:SAM-dependent methyltransferase